MKELISEESRDFIARGILAGVLIAMAAMVFLGIGGGAIGAFCFSVGLLTVFNMKLKLYTGMASTCNVLRYWNAEDVLKVIALNIVGCAIVGLFGSQWVSPSAMKIVSARDIACASPLLILAKGAICNMFIGLAVSNKSSELLTILSVMGFILCGSLHSIAEVSYIFLSGAINFYSVAYVLLVAIGNLIGGQIWYWLNYYIESWRY